ncbi:MAG: DNA-binding response regulator [Bacteroidetes bacterium HGW-Bacteroidetes-21]|jgi:two-component system response regulator NreC|nr:MAG: DNA-binding response regulator [Bacteroidetes bacterium HGW-Bacteroidetes-21]
MIKAFLVDDHVLFRDGLKSLLNESGMIEVTGEAGSSAELKQQLKMSLPDVVLLDISLGRDSGLDVLQFIKRLNENIKVIMVSMFSSEDFVMSAIRNGADGYIPKDTPRAELVAAIEQVCQGHRYFPENIRNIILDGVISKSRQGSDAGKDVYQCLTSREKEVLRMVAEGWSNQEIADQLTISIRTVETHKTNVMQKIGAKTVVDLVKFAIRKKIIQV